MMNPNGAKPFLSVSSPLCLSQSNSLSLVPLCAVHYAARCVLCVCVLSVFVLTAVCMSLVVSFDSISRRASSPLSPSALLCSPVTLSPSLSPILPFAHFSARFLFHTRALPPSPIVHFDAHPFIRSGISLALSLCLLPAPSGPPRAPPLCLSLSCCPPCQPSAHIPPSLSSSSPAACPLRLCHSDCACPHCSTDCIDPARLFACSPDRMNE
jgi:hypothetical protein